MQGGEVAGGGLDDRVATDVAGLEANGVVGVGGSVVEGVVGAEELGTAREGGIAFGGAGVGHGADEIALADPIGDEGGVGEGVIEFEKGGVGGAGIAVCEEDAAFEGGSAGGVEGGDTFLIEEEDDFAAGGDEGGPAGG